jgi:hypothetical protein
LFFIISFLQISINKQKPKQQKKMISVKILNPETGVNKRIEIEKDMTFQCFGDLLTQMFGECENLVWVDNEEDKVGLDSDKDFEIAKKERTEFGFLKIIIIKTEKTETKQYNCVIVDKQKNPHPVQVLTNSGEFTEKWKVKNCWKLPWSTDCKLVFVGGKKGKQLADLSKIVNIFNKPIYPGECGIVTINLTAPLEQGLYYGCWKLVSPTGEVFGPRLTVLVDAVAQFPTRENHTNFFPQRDHWFDELDKLKRMGFLDLQWNRKVLFTNDGDFDATVKCLKTLPKFSAASRAKSDFNQNDFFDCSKEKKEEMQKRINDAKAKSTPAEVTTALCDILVTLGFTDRDNNNRLLTQTDNKIRKTIKMLLNPQPIK